MVKFFVAMSTTPVRPMLFGLRSTAQLTIPLLVLLVGERIWIQSFVLTTLQAQPPTAVSCTSPASGSASGVAELGKMENPFEQGAAFWSTVKMALPPHNVSEPMRSQL